MMQKSILQIALLVATLMSVVPVQAQFPSLPGIPGFGGGSKTAQSVESAAQVLIKAKIAIAGFVAAQIQLDDAINGTQKYEAAMGNIEGLKRGDISSTDAIATTISLGAESQASVEKSIAENKPLDQKNKALVAKATANYVVALIATKSLIDSVKSLSSNPMAAGAELPTFVFLFSKLPGLVASGVGATGNLLKYMGSNGVDMTEANNAAAGLGK